jgi:integration host factor subunit beta
MVNKSDIIKILSLRFAAFSEPDVSHCVNVILNEVSEALANDRSVQFRGFGTFNPVVWKVRLARDPRNGAKVIVPERRRVHFKSSLNLKEHINKGYITTAE